MYTARQKVYWFAIHSRILVFLLQMIFNAICPDHEADAFRMPADPNEGRSYIDGIIAFALGGLTKWDGQHYQHIAVHGYTYESTLAFFPLFPLAMRYGAAFLRIDLSLINYSNLIVITGFAINLICFVKAALTLYDLTEIIFKDSQVVAYRAALLFCINPASIFFSALYTESMFAYLTFYSMLESVKNNPCVFLPLSLSAIVRSNGLVNIGFPIYTWLRDVIVNTIPNYMSENKFYHSNNKSLIFNFRHIFISLSQIVFLIILSLMPFCFLQMHNYSEFCKLDWNETSFPYHVQQYAQNNDLLLRGKHELPWCFFKIPMPYSYIQSKYWNVGPFAYYQLKQIPNFVLAFPILFLMLKCSISFFTEHKLKFYTLKFFTGDMGKKKSNAKYPLEMFVFVAHGLFLTIFCIVIVNIQVSTRLLCSASPILYWHCALAITPKDIKGNRYESQENMLSKWKVFFFTKQQHLYTEKLVLAYFLGYTIIGCFMFPNFLPWT